MRDILAATFTKRFTTILLTTLIVLGIFGVWYYRANTGDKKAAEERAEQEWEQSENAPATEEPISSTPQVTTYSPQPTSTTVTKDSPEYKCACINAGYEVELSDDLVANFGYVFDSLQTKFPGYTRLNIANIVCAAKERIDTSTTAKKSLLDVAHEINNSVPPEAAGAVSLEEVAAVYVGLLRQYGQ